MDVLYNRQKYLQLINPQKMFGRSVMQSVLFLSLFEKMRTKLLEGNTILTRAHFSDVGIDSIGGGVVQTTDFTITNTLIPDYQGAFIRLANGNNEAEKAAMFQETVR